MDANALRLLLRRGGNPLCDLPDDVLAELAATSTEHQLAREQLLFSEGDRAEATYILVSGAMRLVRLDVHGHQQVLHSVSPGQSFAEAAFFDVGTYPATAIASAASTLIGFSRRKMVEVIEGNPKVALIIIATLSRWLRQLSGMVEGLSLKSAEARLAEYLLLLSGGMPKPGHQVILPTSKQELSARLGIAPETLSRTLRQLSERDIIGVDKRRIIIQKPAVLRELDR